MDHTVHVTDLMRWILQDEVREVYAELSNGISHCRLRRCRFPQSDLSAGRLRHPGRLLVAPEIVPDLGAT